MNPLLQEIAKPLEERDGWKLSNGFAYGDTLEHPVLGKFRTREVAELAQVKLDQPRLIAEVERLEKLTEFRAADSRRMEWLEAHEWEEVEGDWHYSVPSVGGGIRAAIDARMEAYPNDGPTDDSAAKIKIIQLRADIARLEQALLESQQKYEELEQVGMPLNQFEVLCADVWKEGEHVGYSNGLAEALRDCRRTFEFQQNETATFSNDSFRELYEGWMKKIENGRTAPASGDGK